MTEINHTDPADRIATAQDYAALSFGPATDRPFDEKSWRAKAADFVALERCVIAVMRMDDKELSTKVAKSEESADSFLEMYDTFETLRQYYKSGIEVVESARARIMVALSRLELDLEVPFIADVDNEGEGGAS